LVGRIHSPGTVLLNHVDAATNAEGAGIIQTPHCPSRLISCRMACATANKNSPLQLRFAYTLDSFAPL
jgi:hypothetical protein